MKTLNDLAKEHREFSAYEPLETTYSDHTAVYYDSRCPICGGFLDTGFNCMVCGKHFNVKQKGSVTCEN